MSQHMSRRDLLSILQFAGLALIVLPLLRTRINRP